MTALLATAAAALFGASDFLGGLASRRVSAIVATLVAQVVGLTVFVLVSLLWPPAAPTTRDLLFGAVAGVAGGIGVLSLYAGLAAGRMSVVAPITAALSGSLPALVSFARGETVAPAGLLGLGLALVAVVLVSYSAADEADDGSAARALLYAVIAGVGFAASMLCYAETATASGVLPLVPARLTTITLLVLLALARRTGFGIEGIARRQALMAGGVDAFANWSLLVSLRLGPVAVASVVSSLYPVTTVLLARFVLDERIRGLQRVGVGIAFVAVVLSALG